MSERLVYIPYSEIEKGSKVVVYGVGGVTSQIMEQNHATHWMKVVSFLDMKWGGIAYKRFVFPPKAIRLLPYNYVLVASLSHRDEMIDILIKYGVDVSKIVCITTEDSTDYIESYHLLAKNHINKWMKKNYLFGAYFHIKWIVKRKDALYYELIDDIENMKSMESLSMDEKVTITLFSLLMEYKKEENFRRWTNQLLEQADKKEIRKRLANYCVDLYFLPWRDPALYYDNYYKDVRTLKEKYMTGIINRDKLSRYFVREPENKRVVLICYCLSMDQFWSAPNRLTVGICEELAKRGYEVHLVVEDSLIKDKRRQVVALTGDDYELSKRSKKINRQEIDDRIKIYYLSSKNRAKALPKLAKQIAQINPALIYNMCDRMGFLAHAFVGLVPVMQFFLSGCISSVPADGYMAGVSVEEQERECKKFGITQKNYFQSPMAAIFPKEGEKMGREYYDLSKDDFVILTIGYDFDTLLKEDFVDMMCRLVQEHKQIKWLIVGPRTNSYLMDTYYDLVKQKRILWRPKEGNMTSMFDVADIYVNPKRLGGGNGIAQSMTEGVPVLMNTYASDGQSWLGVENTIPGDITELRKEILHCYQDREYLQQKADIQRERSKSFSFSHLMDEIEEKTKYVLEDYYKNKK
ncbi:MAG: hypothetical protein SOZ48_02360 [Eubacterium sp.]|nr:hypothetical protein [Eubacterium sp.]